MKRLHKPLKQVQDGSPGRTGTCYRKAERMKMTAIRIFVSLMILILSLGFLACKEQDDQVLLILIDHDYLTTLTRGQENEFHDINIKWKHNRCEITYFDGETQSTKTIELTRGETVSIQTDAIPPTHYEVFFCNAEDSLPEEWEKRLERAEEIKQIQSEYGSIDKYEASRNKSKEMEMIQNAFNAIGVTVRAENWYQLFVEATWYHGDCSIVIEEAKAQLDMNGTICLFLTDENGNQMQIDGAGKYVWGIYYKGKAYYGPFD